MNLSIKISKLINILINFPRFIKRIIVVFVDLNLSILCTWCAFFLRLDDFNVPMYATLHASLISITIFLPVFWLLGVYRTIFRYSGLSIISTLLRAVFIYGLLYFLVIGIYGIPNVPRSIGIIQPMLLFFGVINLRFFIKYLLSGNFYFENKSDNKTKVLVYGAGSAGQQLVYSLESNSKLMEVVGFLDDDKKLQDQVLMNKTVFSPLKINYLINFQEVSLILLAMPSIKLNRKNAIIENLNKYKVTVKTLPTVMDIVDDKVSISDIKDLNIEDLLSREQVEPNSELLSKNISSKVIIVTGAGGSIGSEICRQIIKLKPHKLILLELNEFALYKIYEELILLNKNIKIIPLLNNVLNEHKLNKILKTFKVDTIYHSAAYKHVPLVEENICEGVNNNVFGTLSIARAAIFQKVPNFVLISSDKAVRPTNIMGVSKRLAELCVQGIFEDERNIYTKFSIVRFGNVLESSGSVIPKFKKQIKEGGPVTLTHPEVTRYFMTITEAAQLVIQAGAMAEKCEVFVLDMGESVKIKDLIDKMIKFSGFSIKDSKNLDGDIAIKIIGLKPGEKLYEELLLGDNPQKTYHEKIQKAQDPFIPFNKLKIDLDHLKNLIEENKIEDVKDMLTKLVISYKSNSRIIDHFYEQQLNLKNDLKSSKIIDNEKNKVVRIKT